MMKKRFQKYFLFPLGLALLILLAGRAFAAPKMVVITRQVRSGGGAPAASGHVALNASLGQPVIGEANSSGGVTLNAGFWQPVVQPQPPAGYQLMLPLVTK